MKKVPIKDILKANYIGNIFNRTDIIVRYMAIENYFNKNDVGFDLYKKMEDKRGKCNKDLYLKNFINLIEGVQDNGLSFNCPVICSKSLKLFDGAHRIACAIYFNYYYIAVSSLCCHSQYHDFFEITDNLLRETKYGIENWFISRFSKEEIKIIRDKQNQILNTVINQEA